MKRILAGILVMVLVALPAWSQDQPDTTVDTTQSIPPPAPVTNVNAFDTDDDHGHAITLTWDLSADDGAGRRFVSGYRIMRWIPYLWDSVMVQRGTLNWMISLEGEWAKMQTQIDLLQAQNDSLRADTAEVQDSIIAFNARRMAYLEQILAAQDREEQFKQFEGQFELRIDSLMQRLTPAYEAYPNEGRFDTVGLAARGDTIGYDRGSKSRANPDFIPDYTDLYYKVLTAVKIDDTTTLFSESEVVGPVQSSGQWFNGGRIPVLIAVLIFFTLVIGMVQRAKGGTELYVRPLAGIEAVDEAIGRATEMGRPILYVLGLGTAADIATIASFTILGRVAKRVAEYQTQLLVPTYDPIVMSVAQEVVKSSYFDAGRADDYSEDIVFFVTQSQFAYVAAVNGIMLREHPATNVYMGKFFAESLILAETGALAGSIQISGTDEIAQLPFFIVATDYTLIGEELYAASAYLGREPVLLGSLKAQDYAKAIILVCAVAGLIAANLGLDWFVEIFKVTD